MDLCNQQNITKGLQGKFSVYHGAAVGLVRGKAGLQEYSDEAVNDPAIKRVRERATAVGDPSVTEDQARIEVELTDGRALTKFVAESLGNLEAAADATHNSTLSSAIRACSHCRRRKSIV